MARRILLLLMAAVIALDSMAADYYDFVIVGGTPGGIMTAVSAARHGKSSVILERSSNVGGLPANGLGATDIATRGATEGLFKEFVDRVRMYYVEKYGENSPQVRDCSDGYHFEPKVAEAVFYEMLDECKDKVTVLTGRQFDSDTSNVRQDAGKIVSITVLNLDTREKEEFYGKIFVDATYEGDLGAAAGIPYRTGREDAREFGEAGAGKLYKYWDGKSGDGSTGQGDNAVQAYNFRLCLTDNPSNKIDFRKPSHYDRNEYLSLVEDVLYGRNTNYTMEYVTEEQQKKNREHILAGGRTMIAGDVWGINKLTNMVRIPNGKMDANNQHLAFISTDLPEENWPWPSASWEWRDRFSTRLREYIEGLFWFAANDEALPESFRNAVSKWGYAADEYEDNDNFPRLVYVREGRRLKGEYFFTASDALGDIPGQRPEIHRTSVTSSHYMLDSHAVLKRESGRVHLDGFFSYPSEVYTVPYGVMVSSCVGNLLFPVPVSGSHVGFSTLRMEPCWMALGQAAGLAGTIAIDDRTSVSDIDMGKLQDMLIEDGAVLVYFKDITPDDPDYKMVQKMALSGYLIGWTAELDKPLEPQVLESWIRIAGFCPETVKPGMSRKAALYEFYGLASRKSVTRGEKMSEKKEIRILGKNGDMHSAGRSTLMPFRLPLPMQGSAVEYEDLDSDGYPDIMRATLSDGTPVQWLDDNADMKIGDIEGDMTDDCLMVDRNKDGKYGSYEDLIIDWADTDGDGHAEMQVVVDNVKEADKGVSGGGHYMWVIDTDKDNIFNYINWNTYQLECWEHGGSSDFYTDYHGNSAFIKIHSTPERLNNIKLSWENPFLFYDTDNDGLTEMTLRLCDSRYKKIFREDGTSRLSGQSDWMALSIDVDNDHTPSRPFDLDMTLNFRGSGSSYTMYSKRFHMRRGLPETDSLFLDPVWRQNDELIFPDHGEALDFMYKKAEWDEVWFVFDEDDDCERWERVELYEPGDLYRLGEGNGGLDNNRQADVIGDRGEWDTDNSGNGCLYVSPVDGKIHLLGAEKGAWRIDQTARYYQGMGGIYDSYGPGRLQEEPKSAFPVITYEDTDGNGFFDRFCFDLDGDRQFEETVSLSDLGIDDCSALYDPSEMSYDDYARLFSSVADDMWSRAQDAIAVARTEGLNIRWYSVMMYPKSPRQKYDYGFWLQLYIYRDLKDYFTLQDNKDRIEDLKQAYFSGEWLNLNL